MSDGITSSEIIGDRHSGLVGVAYSTDAELLRQCAASGQVPASAIVAHGLQAETAQVFQRSDVFEAPPAPYRCIKPQCPNDCDMCNHAIPSDDAALVLVADLLDGLAVDGMGGPLEDGESALVDRARRFLAETRSRNARVMASSGPVCGNCDTAVPPGCGGIFKDDGQACALNDASGVAPAALKRPLNVELALSVCRDANSAAILSTPMCWDLTLYVQRLEAAAGVSASCHQTLAAAAPAGQP